MTIFFLISFWRFDAVGLMSSFLGKLFVHKVQKMVTNLFQNGNKKQLTIKSDSSSDNASDESIEQTVVQALIDMYRHFKTKKLSYMNLIRKQQFL